MNKYNDLEIEIEKMKYIKTTSITSNSGSTGYNQERDI